MRPTDISHMFGSLTFMKTATEIVVAAKAKIELISAKIEERQKRLADLRREYNIDDAALIQLLTAARKQQQSSQYTNQYIFNTTQPDQQSGMVERAIGAGVVNNLLTENDFIEAEREEVKKLKMIARNLKDIPRYAENGMELPPAGFMLCSEELQYLGF